MNYYELSCIGLSLMIQVQILVGDLHKSHLGLDDVIGGPQQFFANNSRLKRTTDMGVVSLCSSCQDASKDMQYDLLGSTCDLTWPWPEVKYKPDHARSPGTGFDAPWREEHDGAWFRPLSCLVRKLFAKAFLQKKTLLGVFWPLKALVLMLTQIWLHVSERTAHELSHGFSPASYLK